MSGRHAGPGLADAERGSAPWSEEAELSVLGSVFADPDALEVVVSRVSAADFYKEAHRRVFDAIRQLYERGSAVDATTVSAELRDAGHLEAVGGMSYLAQLVDAVPTSAGLGDHLLRLKEHTARRRGIEACAELEKRFRQSAPGQVGTVVSEARERMENLEGPGTLDGVDLIRMSDWLENPDALAPPECIAHGVAYVGQQTIAFGDPKVGKTSLGLAMGASVSAGRRFLGEPTVQGRVLYLAAEGDPNEIFRGLHEFGADPEMVDVVIPGPDPVGELRELMDAEDYRLVLVDTLGKWMAPTEVDRWKQSEVDTVLTPLERIIRDSDAGLVAIHHANAEGKPIDSTAFAAWADVLRKVEDGSSDRERKVTGRARFPVPDLRFRLVQEDGRSRLAVVDPDREAEEKILDYLDANEDASKRAIRRGVDARAKDVDRALETLVQEGIVERDTSGRAHTHRIRQDPQGHATDTVGHGSGHGSADQEAESVSGGGRDTQRVSPPGTRPADSAGSQP